MNLRDALFNWVQIKTVADARPEDGAAKETMDFFADILREDHQLEEVAIRNIDELRIHIEYVQEGVSKQQMFDREVVERLLADIEANPKYNE